jgi:hypothetical protein
VCESVCVSVRVLCAHVCGGGGGRNVCKQPPFGDGPTSSISPRQERFFAEKGEHRIFLHFRVEILAISPRSCRPDVPILTPETHFCGVRGG